jgi:hypothetical protein
MPRSDLTSDRAQFVRDEIRHINYLRSRADADVVRGRRTRDFFHECFIDGRRFRGYLSFGGLAIDSDGACELGDACSITHSTRIPAEFDQWWVCRYSSREPRICLEGMSGGALHALGYEFGISICPGIGGVTKWIADGHQVFRSTWYTFYLSPAFLGLVAWAREHPRKVRTACIGSSSLGDWQNAAIHGRYLDL